MGISVNVRISKIVYTNKNRRTIVIVCQLGCDVINFEFNLILIIKPFFYMTKKSRQKLKYLENEKRFQNEKHFSSFLKGFH